MLSAVGYHVTQSIVGTEGIGNIVKNNPNIIGKLLSGLAKGSGKDDTNNDDDDDQGFLSVKTGAPDTKAYLPDPCY